MEPTSTKGRTRRRRWPLIAGIAAVPVIAIVAIYLIFFTPDSPDRFSIDESTSSGSGSGSGSSSGSSTPADAASMTGTWKAASGTEVGYRVREKLGPAPAASDAVGRTTDVTGQATLAASGDALQLTAATFEADLTTLKSNEGRRDNRIRSLGLESDRFPTATFTSTKAIDIPAAALDGDTIDVGLVGDLKIHGVTKNVTIPAKAKLHEDRIQVVGSLQFPWSDFGMSEPNVGGIVSIQGNPTLEFDLSLAKTGGSGSADQ